MVGVGGLTGSTGSIGVGIGTVLGAITIGGGAGAITVGVCGFGTVPYGTRIGTMPGTGIGAGESVFTHTDAGNGIGLIGIRSTGL